jgi:ABC-2 type transport system ATP-binding protein
LSPGGGIRAEGLCRRFGDRMAVQDLTFEVAPGEVFGLLGPNGAGKTTTVRMLAGLLPPSSGEATVCGLPVRDGAEALRRRVGLLTEQPGLYDRLTGWENLQFFIRLNELDPTSAWARARRYLERFGLWGRQDEPAGSYSKGMRQKLAIVRALVHDPEVLFLDEPTSGLDPESARTVRDAIAELASEAKTLVLCSHNLAEVERLCGRVGVVSGRLVGVSEVKGLRGEGHLLEVRVDGDASRLLPALAGLPFAPDARAVADVLQVQVPDESAHPEVVRRVVAQGARVYRAGKVERALEEVYLELLKGAA